MPVDAIAVEEFDIDLMIEESTLEQDLSTLPASVPTGTPTCPITPCEC
jgi:hypothetical protein